MRSLEGANCADLPGFVVDKYFNAPATNNAFTARVAKAICARCVVLAECRDEAVSMASPPRRGIIGGVSAAEVQAARSWRHYEQGHSDRVPRQQRPAWLPMTDAAHQTEHLRTELDVDEPVDHPAADCHD